MREVLRDANMLCHCVACGNYLRRFATVLRLLHPCSEVGARAQYMHYLEFPYGTVNRNYPEQIFSKDG